MVTPLDFLGKFSPRFQHDCEDCEYLGTLEVKGFDGPLPQDFYKCPRGIEGVTYVARYGDGGYESVSMSGIILDRTPIEALREGLAVLKQARIVDTAEVGGLKSGFGVNGDINTKALNLIASPFLTSVERDVFLSVSESRGEKLFGRFMYQSLTVETMTMVHSTMCAALIDESQRSMGPRTRWG
jgi:hypothetical protein